MKVASLGLLLFAAAALAACGGDGSPTDTRTGELNLLAQTNETNAPATGPAEPEDANSVSQAPDPNSSVTVIAASPSNAL